MKKSILFMIFGWLLAVSAWPQSGTCGDNLTWELKDGTLTISGTGTMENFFFFSTPWANYRESIQTAVISKGITSIGDGAFVFCSELTSVTIPDGVANIGDGAFAFCSELTSVAIPNSVTSIGEIAFAFCSNLTQIEVSSENTVFLSKGGIVFSKDETQLLVYPAGKTEIGYAIPNHVTSIGQNAFISCVMLTSVSISNSVTSIGEGAFASCSGLTSVTIPGSVTNIDDNAFANCNSLASIIIPGSVTDMGVDAFANCKNLTSVTILDGVTRIGWGAFSSCSSLDSVTIPTSVTSIGNWAFEDCSSLSEITCLNPTPPALGSDVFSFVNTASCTLKVPTGSKAAYLAADQWKDFLNIVEVSVSSLPPLSNETASFVFTEHGIQITGCDPQDQVSVYDLAGCEVCRAIVSEGSIRCPLTKGETYIVRIGQKAVKTIKW